MFFPSKLPNAFCQMISGIKILKPKISNLPGIEPHWNARGEFNETIKATWLRSSKEMHKQTEVLKYLCNFNNFSFRRYDTRSYKMSIDSPFQVTHCIGFSVGQLEQCQKPNRVCPGSFLEGNEGLGGDHCKLGRDMYDVQWLHAMAFVQLGQFVAWKCVR